MNRQWLADWPWETVVTINSGLCKEKNALHKPTSDGYESAQTLWDNSRQRELTLRQTLDIFRRCHKGHPVLFLQRHDLCRHRPAFLETISANTRGSTLQ
jgi:hypothetical protein